MRGEDICCPLNEHDRAGSPPHARGRQYQREIAEPTTRITPACAGKTAPALLSRMIDRDHPRMRGEDVPGGIILKETEGSPPHARGRHARTRLTKGDMRITPACAGKTNPVFDDHKRHADHPRMRGEDSPAKCTNLL